MARIKIDFTPDEIAHLVQRITVAIHDIAFPGGFTNRKGQSTNSAQVAKVTRIKYALQADRKWLTKSQYKELNKHLRYDDRIILERARARCEATRILGSIGD